jgi:hypothetical protein
MNTVLLLKKISSNPDPKAKYKRFAQHFYSDTFPPSYLKTNFDPCVLVGRPEVKKPLGRPGHRWENNIKMDLQEVRWSMDWTRLAQNSGMCRTLVNVEINLRFHKLRGIS